MTIRSQLDGQLDGPLAPARRQWRADGAWRLMSLTPFGLALVLAVASTGSIVVGLNQPPTLAGLPLDLLLDAIALAWAALGAYVVWTARSLAAATVALTFATAPAIIVLILGPAAILILQNLA